MSDKPAAPPRDDVKPDAEAAGQAAETAAESSAEPAAPAEAVRAAMRKDSRAQENDGQDGGERSKHRARPGVEGTQRMRARSRTMPERPIRREYQGLLRGVGKQRRGAPAPRLFAHKTRSILGHAGSQLSGQPRTCMRAAKALANAT